MIKKVAEKYINLNLSVIPIGDNKVPLGKWSNSQNKIIKDLNGFDGAKAIGLVCGKVSGNLEVIDIDCKYDLTGKLFNSFFLSIRKELRERIAIQKTQNNGYHLFYRCPTIGRSKKIARREATEEEKKSGEKIKILIETRGEGGYVCVYPTKGYSFIQKHLNEIPLITEDERMEILSCGVAFNSVDENAQMDEIFKDYNERESAIPVLLKYGWTETGKNKDNILLKRPGETNSQWSASYHIKNKWFTVFSTSTEFQDLKAYSPVAVLAKLEFNDDWKALHKYLIDNGYGRKKEPDTPPAKIAKLDTINIYLKSVIDDTLRQGDKIGVYHLDKYFCFKNGLYLINGFDNVGKSVMMLWKFVKQAQKNNWRFMIYSGENSNGFMARKIIEFSQKKILNECDMVEGTRFLNKHFSFVDNNYLYDYKQLLKLFMNSDFNGFAIDPYDALKVKLTPGYNTYNYHEQAVTELQFFCRKHERMIWLNLHTHTGAARKTDKDGLPSAPQKADTNYGVLFANSGDFFITYHRKVQSREKERVMEIHVRKVRETETGGKCTIYNDPVMFELNPEGTNYEFYDDDDFSPTYKNTDDELF